VCSSIYIISQEEIVCVWNITADFEELKDIIELAMNIADECYWAVELNDVVFCRKNLFDFSTDKLNYILF